LPQDKPKTRKAPPKPRRTRPERTLPQDLEEFVLRDSIVDGRRVTLADIGRTWNLDTKRLGAALKRVEDELLAGYGLDPEATTRRRLLEIVKTIEAVKLSCGDMEILMEFIRRKRRMTPEDRREMREAALAKSRLSKQRDALLLKLRTEERVEEKSKREGPTKKGAPRITINNGKI